MDIRKIIIGTAFMACPALVSAQYDINDGAWKITWNPSQKQLTYSQNGKDLVRGAYVEILDAEEQALRSDKYPTVNLKKESVNDAFGAGTKYTYTYSGLAGEENIEQNIYIYPGKNYILVDAALVATSGTTRTHRIAPIVSETTNTVLPTDGRNVVYDMPHDNDNWLGYSAYPFSVGKTNTSCEVSAVYDVNSRNGLIIGSIEHDNWKSGITIAPSGNNRFSKLEVYAGDVSIRTNDINDGVHEGRPSLYKHGSISGQKVSSPRYFFGLYNDWRDGLEELGEATATLAPKLPWDKGTIFAWQSWGGMEARVNYEGVMDVCDFYIKQLMPKKFYNENGECYMILDSFWDRLSPEQLRQFADYCKAHNMHPGIYHTPFSYWGTEEQAAQYRPYEGSQWTWADISLRANGKLRKITSIALDPTHPGTIEYNRRKFEFFRNLGFEYIKLDFINNGTLEADSYYDKNVTTGMQAYTYGMKYVLEMAGDMFVDLSIAPVFPAMAHARRISCDCWGEMDNSQYCLNSLGMAWWLDRVYPYNDPDNLVLHRSADDGERRIRYTSGVMSGVVMLGDNFALVGDTLGTQTQRDYALKFATNDEVNEVGRQGRSFRPVEGSLDVPFNRWNKIFYNVDREFVLDTDDALYYAVFNYDKNKEYGKAADFGRIGIDAANVKSIKELWTGQKVSFAGNGFQVTVPKGDVCLYRIDKKKSGKSK